MNLRRGIAALIVCLAVSGPVSGLEAQSQGRGSGNEKKAQQGQAKGQKQDSRPAKAHRQGGGSDKAVAGKQQGKVQRDDRQGSGKGQQKQQARGSEKRGSATERAGTDRSGRERAAVSRAVRSADAERARGRTSFVRNVVASELRPDVRRYVAGGRVHERIAAGAVARAFARGVDDDKFIIAPAADRVYVRNRSGDLLLDLDRDRARNLGHWDVRPIGYSTRSDGPSFCRSGAGHPVWGREWCLDKGFGLGRDRDIWWGRTTDVRDVIFGRRIDGDRLARDMLIATLGNVVLDRLGLHAITLGYAEPLRGVWIGEPTGPQVLQVYSGDYTVAEIVDADRDDRADVMLVALRPW